MDYQRRTSDLQPVQAHFAAFALAPAAFQLPNSAENRLANVATMSGFEICSSDLGLSRQSG